MVRSPLGRIRHLPTIRSFDNEISSLAKRQAINSPIQSCLADMMEWAIALIDAEFPNEEVEVVGNIHDAIVAYIDEDKVATILPQVMHIMSNLPLGQLGWNPPLKFTVDAEYGSNLAAVKKFKLAA
jgi:DNA polymerase I-like protein with 3'-5' exonuclease and polymerase domains